MLESLYSESLRLWRGAENVTTCYCLLRIRLVSISLLMLNFMSFLMATLSFFWFMKSKLSHLSFFPSLSLVEVHRATYPNGLCQTSNIHWKRENTNCSSPISFGLSNNAKNWKIVSDFHSCCSRKRVNWKATLFIMIRVEDQRELQKLCSWGILMLY